MNADPISRPGRLRSAVSKLKVHLQRLDNQHTYLMLSAAIVTGWLKWMPSTAAWILFTAIWLMVALDMFELYLRKINRRGRLLAEAGIL